MVGQTLARLVRCKCGQTSVLFALMLVPVFLSLGAAIDFVSANRLRTKLQSSLDAAAIAMATASDQTDAARKEIGLNYLKRHFSGTQLEDIEPNITISTDTVVISATYAYPTSFMSLGGTDHVIIKEMSEVMRPFEGMAELVLVLDYSGSMNQNNKYQDMRDAATTMLGDLNVALKPGNLKVGLVPFSAMVRASMDKSYVNQASATQTWTGCTQDRKYPHNTNVDTPTSDPDTKWGYIDGSGENNGGYGCSAYNNKHLTIQPLTTNVSSVTSALADMRPLGNTNISLGVEFGWNLMDPQLPFDEGAPYSDKLTRKFLVVLTDGVQTSSEFGSDSGRSVANATKNLVEICSNARATGITIFTIAYDVKDADVTDLLKACAPGRYFEPGAGGSEISAVFSQIKGQIQNRIARVSK